MVVDRDGDSIIINLEGLDDAPCGCITVNVIEESTMKAFTISVDTTKIT